MEQIVQRFIELRQSKYSSRTDMKLKESFIRSVKDMNKLDELKEYFGNNRDKFVESFLEIVDKKGKKLPFKLNKAQQYIHSTLKDIDYQGKLYIYKSRQQGSSKISSALVYTGFATNENFKGLSVNLTKEDVEANFKTNFKMFHSQVPSNFWDETEKLEYSSSKELRTVSDKSITVDTMGSDTGRGDMFRELFASEVAFKDDFDEVLLSLNASMTPDSMQIYESTSNGKLSGNGDTNWWYGIYEKSLAGELPLNNKVIFMPFHLSDEYEVPLEMAPQSFYTFLKIGSSCDELQKMFDYLPKLIEQYGKDSAMRKCLFFYIKWQELGVMVSASYPLSIEDSFIANERNLISYEAVKRMRSQCKAPVNVVEDAGVKVSFFKARTVSGRYVIGFDPSASVGKDYSSVAVIDITTMEVVATAQSNTADLTTMVNVIQQLSNHFKRAIVVCERNGIGGGYISTFIRRRIPMYIDERLTGSLKTNENVGYTMTKNSKLIMLDGLRNSIEDGELIIFDPYLVALFESVQVKADGSALNHVPDLVIAVGLAMAGIQQALRKSRIANAPILKAKKQSKIVYEWDKKGKLVPSTIPNYGIFK